MMGNSAGWKHEARYTRCVGYLPERTHRALNKNARVKLHIDEAKPCILFSLVPHWSCVGVGVIAYCSLVIYFPPCKWLVGKNTRGMYEEFCYRPEISCSHPCFKGNWL